VVLDGKVYHLRAPKRRTEVRMSSLKAVIRQGWEFWRPVTTTERWELV
jgi:hypothetical protein